MLAGVGAVDACLLVVAATEGWKPQSEEHLRILDLLGVGAGVVALTKAGLVGAARIAAVMADVAERLARTLPPRRSHRRRRQSVTGAASTPWWRRSTTCSASPRPPPTGAAPGCGSTGRFPIRGAGTVVTGTLAGGSLAVGDPGRWPPDRRPAPPAARCGSGASTSTTQPRSQVGPGHRAAVNLTGADHHALGRGRRRGQSTGSGTRPALRRLPAACSTASTTRCRGGGPGPSTSAPASTPPACASSAPRRIEPGGHGLVRVHLPVALPLLPGDRYVLREHGRSETVGGGEILDVDPVLPAARARPDRSVERVVGERGWVDADLLGRLTGTTRAPTWPAGGWSTPPC